MDERVIYFFLFLIFLWLTSKIAGVISNAFISIITLFSNFFYKLLKPIVILKYQQKILCINCFRYSLPLNSRYENGIRYCEHCGDSMIIDDSVISIKQVIGVIGGKLKNYKLHNDKIYVKIWFQREKKSRNADIDILYIRKSSSNISYDWAINSVHTTLVNDISRPRGWLKKIPVIIDKDLALPQESINLLKSEFKEISFK